MRRSLLGIFLVGMGGCAVQPDLSERLDHAPARQRASILREACLTEAEEIGGKVRPRLPAPSIGYPEYTAQTQRLKAFCQRVAMLPADDAALTVECLAQIKAEMIQSPAAKKPHYGHIRYICERMTDRASMQGDGGRS